ncbi:MAG: hypothetical protein Q4Q03_08200 [Bowdeniella nasicola]|nr:hypothetical protein [Bowdeniella nasicola]
MSQPDAQQPHGNQPSGPQQPPPGGNPGQFGHQGPHQQGAPAAGQVPPPQGQWQAQQGHYQQNPVQQTSLYGAPSGGQQVQQVQIPAVVQENREALKSGVIAGLSFYAIGLIVGLILTSIAFIEAYNAPGGFGVFIGMVFLIAGTSFGSGIAMKASNSSELGSILDSSSNASGSAGLVFLTVTIIAAIAVYYAMKITRKGEKFRSPVGLAMAIVSAALTLILLHVILGLIGTLGLNESTAVVDASVRPTYGFAIFAAFVIMALTLGIYQLYRISHHGVVNLWLLRVREVLPYLALAHLFAGAVVFIHMLLSQLYYDVLRPTEVIFTLLFGLGHIIVLAPALLFGVSLNAGGSEFTGGSSSIYAFAPGWVTAITIILTIVAMVAVGFIASKRLPAAPFIRTGIFAAVFFIAGLIIMLFQGVHASGTGDLPGVGSALASIRINASGLLILVMLVWGVVIELISRYAGVVFSQAQVAVAQASESGYQGPSQFAQGQQQVFGAGGPPQPGQAPMPGHVPPPAAPAPQPPVQPAQDGDNPLPEPPPATQEFGENDGQQPSPPPPPRH